MKTLVVGYGNITRGDDGAGVYTAEQIEKKKWPDVEVRTLQQLSIELLEDFKDFSRIILIDVSPQAAHVILRPVLNSDPSAAVSSHHLSPAHLLKLAASMGYSNPELYICMIPGKCFDFDGNISEETRVQTDIAVRKIKKLLLTGNVIPSEAKRSRGI